MTKTPRLWECMPLACLLTLSHIGQAVARALCTTNFTDISAADFIRNLNPGWNLGNTLDAFPDEGSWNNVPVVPSTFDDVKAAGFKSVRIGVTYADHYVGSSPDWTVNTTWLKRLSGVIDIATDRGLYVITNMHHDAERWADVTQAGANVTMIQEKFYATWLQIGKTLACKSAMVAVEPINEPSSNTAADAAHIMAFNMLLLRALTESGGHNARRVVTLIGPGEDGQKTTQYFVPPKNITNPWAIQFHYYSPYNFIFGAWGKTIWGSESDKAALTTDLAIVRGNFTDVPLLIGEFSASPTNCEASARWRYTDFLMREARSLNISVMLWDNGADNLDRISHIWRDRMSIDIITGVTDTGMVNSLPDGTTDEQATTQWTSAYIFQRMGEPVREQTLSFLLQGNRFVSVSVQAGSIDQSSTHASMPNGTTAMTMLASPSDYSVNGSSLILKREFLSKYVSPNATHGVKAKVYVAFSSGVPVPMSIVQWDTPALAATTSKAVAGADLKIPITYRGLKKVAAVKLADNNGTYLLDDWTKYLGPLQQGRATFSNQWNFDDDNVVISSSAIQLVIANGRSAIFTFEFFPRVPGNAVNYTLTV